MWDNSSTGELAEDRCPVQSPCEFSSQPHSQSMQDFQQFCLSWIQAHLVSLG